VLMSRRAQEWFIQVCGYCKTLPKSIVVIDEYLDNEECSQYSFFRNGQRTKEDVRNRVIDMKQPHEEGSQTALPNIAFG